MTEEKETLYQIKAPHFVCGIVLSDRGRVVECAPIVRYMRSWGSVRIFSYCQRQGWEIQECDGTTSNASNLLAPC